MTTPTPAPAITIGSTTTAPIELSLGIEGMTCASCVNRIERFLRRTDGVVRADVNLATERATVRFDPAVAGRAELVKAIEAAGYDVRPDRTAIGSDPRSTVVGLSDVTDEETAARAREQRDLGIRAAVSLVVAAGIMAAMFWPGGVGLQRGDHDVAERRGGRGHGAADVLRQRHHHRRAHPRRPLAGGAGTLPD